MGKSESIIDTTPVTLLCGNRAWLDPESSIGAYRCETCNTVVFSIAMPRVCKELYEKEELWRILNK